MCYSVEKKLFVDLIALQAVVYPLSTDEVSKIMKVCHDHKIPVTGKTASINGLCFPILMATWPLFSCRLKNGP